MKIHKCEKCGYETKYTTNLKNHLNRKNPCDIPKIHQKMVLVGTKNPPTNTKTLIECPTCNKGFTKKSSLVRHLKFKRCKDKDILSNEMNVKQKDFLELKNKLEKVEEELKNIKEKPATTTINNTNTNSHNRTKNINNYYCVPFDNRSIKHVLDMYYDVDVFYKGPKMVIKLLYEEFYQKDIFLLDYARQKFQYKYKMKKEDPGKLIVDLKNEWSLGQIQKEYQRHTYGLSEGELLKHEGDPAQQEIIEDLVKQHDETSNILNMWSKMWCNTCTNN